MGVTAKLNDYKCKGKRECSCNACTGPGDKTLGGPNDNKAKNLEACWGECDNDSQCAKGLKCFQRSKGEKVPGCTGKGGGAKWDYCYGEKTLGGTNDNKAKTLNHVGESATVTAKCLGSRKCTCKRCTETNGKAAYGSKCKKDGDCNNGWCDGKTAAACSGTCKKFVSTGGKCGGSITAKLNDYKCTRSDGLGRCKNSRCYILKLKGKSCGKYNNWECKSNKCKCQKWKFLKCTGGWKCE